MTAYLRTSDLATAVGVHPNTVRRYADRGILPPVARSQSGYCRFTPRLLDCLRLDHLVYGRRVTAETLAVRYRGHDIAQVLDVTVEDALAHFADVPAARARLQVLADVGLGYLQLGQAATTLSGGAAGDRLIAEGTPEQVAQFSASNTGHSLRETLHTTAFVG